MHGVRESQLHSVESESEERRSRGRLPHDIQSQNHVQPGSSSCFSAPMASAARSFFAHFHRIARSGALGCILPQAPAVPVRELLSSVKAGGDREVMGCVLSESRRSPQGPHPGGTLGTHTFSPPLGSHQLASVCRSEGHKAKCHFV